MDKRKRCSKQIISEKQKEISLLLLLGKGAVTMVVTGKDRLSPGDRILYNKKTGQIMFKRGGKPFVLSSIGSSIIFIGPNCIIEGVIRFIDVLLRPSGLRTEVKESTENSFELSLNS